MSETDPNEYEVGHRFEVRRKQREASFDFIYPRSEDDRVQSLTVGLEDVRAANDITIRFDFERDGWVITSGTKFMWMDGEDATDDRPEEVGFIPSWSEAAGSELDRVNS